MADIKSPAERSYNMSRIRDKDTKPEMVVRRFLFANGFRYRVHDKRFPGKPDLVLPKYQTVISVHGCFWHGHEGCKYFVVPKTRTQWWVNKIKRNKELDHENKKKLMDMGWKVIAIFECELKKDLYQKTSSELILNIKS